MPDESINVASITSVSASRIYIFNSTARLLLRNNNELGPYLFTGVDKIVLLPLQIEFKAY